MPEEKDVYTRAWEFLVRYAPETLRVTGQGSVVVLRPDGEEKPR